MKQAAISALFGAISGAIIVALSLGIGPLSWIFGAASASQNQLSSPTTGTVSGLQLTNNFNNAIDSVNTCNSGPSAPTNQLSGVPSVGNCWINTTSIPYPVSIYDGANWDVIAHIDATNHWATIPVGGGVATEASAATTDLCSSANKSAHYITISGTTTITSFGSTCQPGFVKLITFSGSLTLTYNATSMIFPGAQNIITAAGDQAIVVALGSGNFQIVNYTPASGQALLNPAIDVGDVIFTHLTAPPSSKYLFEYGQAISRTTYSSLLNSSMYPTFTGITATSGSPTLVGFSDTSEICSGQAVIEATFLPNSPYPTIISCTSSTVTMNANAIASTTGNVQVFPYGDGNGSTTFNLPNCQGVALVGRDNMSGTPRGALTSTYFGVNPDALGATGGAQNRTIAQNQLPNVAPSISGSGNIALNNTGQNIYAVGSSNIPEGTGSDIGTIVSPNQLNIVASAIAGALTVGSINGNVSQQALPTIPPALTVNCMVRVLSMLDLSPLPSVPANDDQFASAVEPRRSVA
jgi:microcystin-dependent protein